MSTEEMAYHKLVEIEALLKQAIDWQERQTKLLVAILEQLKREEGGGA